MKATVNYTFATDEEKTNLLEIINKFESSQLDK